jgi:putative ABC transport system substrate-binding protein
MGRRNFLLGLASMAAVHAVGLRAGERIFRVGFLSREKPYPTCGKWVAEVLRPHGFEIGRNLEIRCVFLENRETDAAFLARKAKELVGLDPDLIIALSNLLAGALGDETKSIPIAFAVGGFSGRMPVGTPGRPLAKEWARPGGNMTGVVVPYLELTFKRLELSRELLPSARRVALLANYPQMRTQIPAFREELEAGARSLGLELLEADASRDGGDIAATFARVMRRKADAVLVFGEVNFKADRVEVIEALELSHRVPVIFDIPGRGVLALGPDWNATLRRAVELGARILKGARPADIPLELENRYLMAVNLKRAAAIGLEVPRSLVLRADRVIDGN